MKNPMKTVWMTVLMSSAVLFGTHAYGQVSGAAGAGVTPGANARANAAVGPVGTGTTGINGAGTTSKTSPPPASSESTPAAAMNSQARANAANATMSTGVATSGDVNSPDLANNTGSVNRSTQSSAGKMNRRATAEANAAEIETTRQLNQQGVTTTSGAAAP